MLENSCVWSSVPFKASYCRIPSLCVIPVYASLWTELLNVLQCIYRNNKNVLRYQKLQHSVRMLSFGIDTGPQLFYHSFVALADDTLFEVSAEIRCSGLSSRYCCRENCANWF